jgi:hypothetical protein
MDARLDGIYTFRAIRLRSSAPVRSPLPCEPARRRQKDPEVNDAPKATIATLAFLGALASASIARATPEFPGDVDKCLSLTGSNTVEMQYPPLGCQLCHVSPGGNLPMSDFGTLMYAFGALPYQGSGTACKAITAIQNNGHYGPLITDITSDINPNTDKILVDAPKTLYGCGLAAAALYGPGAGVVGAVFLAIFGLGFARRRLARTGA